MRITEFIHTLHVGGAERLAVDLVICLARRGHQASVVSLHGTGELEPELRDHGIQFLAMEKKTGLDLKPLIQLQRFLREHQIQVLHTHNTHLHHHGVLAARAAGVQAVVNTVHGLVNVPQGQKARMIYKAAALATDRVTTVCQPVQEALGTQLSIPASMVEIVHNGIDPQRFLAAQPRPPDGNVVFGTIGRFVEVKNQCALVEAFAQVHRQRPHTRLRLMGYGPLKGALEATIAALQLGHAVDMVDGGTADGAEFLSQLDVFVMSSLSEGLPVSLLEAMAAARVVIGTPVGAIPEVIQGGKCGWLSESPDAAAMAKVMLQAVDAPNRQELAQRARRHALQHFTLEQMARSYEQLFERVLSATQRDRMAVAG